MPNWTSWVRGLVLILVGAAAGLVIAGHLSHDPAVFHLSTVGVKWTDFVAAIGTALAGLVASIAAFVAYFAFGQDRLRERGLAVSRCDLEVTGECFSYGNGHMVRVCISIKNLSSRRLELSSIDLPFVQVKAYTEELRAFIATQPSWDDIFRTVPHLIGTTVLKESFLETQETIIDTLLLPVDPPPQVLAYRVEFGVTIIEPTDKQPYSWHAVDFVPVVGPSSGSSNCRSRAIMGWLARRMNGNPRAMVRG